MSQIDLHKTLPEILGDYTRRNAARFHMPGHKGQGMPLSALWDVTELPGTDDLHDPSAAILETELKYKRAYGSRHSFLLVGGGTAGITAMLLALGSEKRILLDRSCHRSALSGAAFAGHDLIPLIPPRGGLITPEQVDEALKASPVDAILITSPDYYGRCANVSAIAKAAHAHGALLLVDHAHGAHFPFSPRLPDFPARDVDLWCTSQHKTMNALTQSAVLHLGHSSPIGIEKIRRSLAMVESSSPSYLLMSSLDWALHSAGGWNTHVDRILNFRRKIACLNGLVLPDALAMPGVVDVDPTRMVIDVTGRGISGAEAARSLMEQDVMVEMADDRNIVMITTPSDPDEWYDRLFGALSLLPYGTQEFSDAPLLAPGEKILSVRKAMLSNSELVPLEDAVGRVAAEPAGVYPPGTPLLFPGERITAEAAAYLMELREEGLTLFGAPDGCAYCVIDGNDL